jgi:hypothetical protein
MMIKLKKLISESKYLKREFGEPLPTFKGVMKQHQINKLQEDWWDDMSPENQAQYIKDHPGSQQAKDAGGDDEGGGERLGQIAQERAAAEQEMADAEEMGDKNAYADAQEKIDDLDKEEAELGGSGD